MPPPRQPAVLPDQAYEYLDRAQRLLEAPCPPLHQSNSWITSTEAVDAQRIPTEPHSDLAVAYCVIGSVKAVVHYTDDPLTTYKYIISLLNMANPRIIANDNIPQVNDTTQASAFNDIVLMFEKAKTLALRFAQQSRHQHQQGAIKS